MEKQVISTEQAPSAIGTYSQAVRVDKTVYLSGQIPLDPGTMELVSVEFEPQAQQVFKNLEAVIAASSGSFDNVVKVMIFMTDLTNFPTVNEVMSQYFGQPYPARAAVQVAGLPKGALIEIDAIMVVD